MFALIYGSASIVKAGISRSMSDLSFAYRRRVADAIRIWDKKKEKRNLERHLGRKALY